MPIDLDDLIGGASLREAQQAEVARRPRLLPDPPRRDRRYVIISVDDHLVEPPDAFAGRFPRRLADRAPRVVSLEGGGESWLYDGRLLPNVGFNAVAGIPFEDRGWDPVRFDAMRRGAWDVDARVADMDLNGVYASVCFPSYLVGFGGGRLQTATPDRELALTAVRAYNDWHAEAWCAAHPDRLIPCGITWLHDPAVGADEVRRNAERGFHALTFPEAPHRLGLPSISSDHWEPILRACSETGTVVCLHVGSGGGLPQSDDPDAPMAVMSAMFGMVAMQTALDWIFAGHLLRFPDLRVCLSEGGIGWVAGLRDRLYHAEKKLGRRPQAAWADWDLTPSEVLLHSFSFCFLTDPNSLKLRDLIGVDHIMFETDYPHSDSSWPDSQSHLHEQIGDMEADDVERLTWRNAATLFRHPVPAAVQRDPDAF